MADKALLCGVNRYADLNMSLRGPVSDATRFLRNVLAPLYGFGPGDVVTLFDDRCTTDELRTALRWLTEDRQPGDRTCFYFSGHGSLMPGAGPGRNILCTHDINAHWLDPVTDREVQEVLDALGRSEFFADCCHSGTFGFDNPDAQAVGVKGGLASQADGGTASLPSLAARYIPFGGSPGPEPLSVATRSQQGMACGSGAAVYFHEAFKDKAQWGACLDEQVAYELGSGGEFWGLFSQCLVKHLTENPNLPRLTLMQEMGRHIQARYGPGLVQTPTLATATGNVQKPFFVF